jgi:hypothetical protein
LPALAFADPPASLCREAAQLRLDVRLPVDAWPPTEAITWTLASEGDELVARGEFAPPGDDLVVSFPRGEPLPPGAYAVSLTARGEEVARHAFEVLAEEGRITALGVALTPAGPAVTRLPADAHVLYLLYDYAGVCSGAPLWASVSREGELLCRHNLNLEGGEGAGALPCYEPGGGPLESGVYRVVLTLLGERVRALSFRVGEPTATYAPECAPPFAAVGVSPTGHPVRPSENFQWYTQGVYVGAECRDMPPGQTWEAEWYREGQLLQEHAGMRTGEGTGVIWDSLVGTEEVPFLAPGSYSVTLTLEGVEPLTTTFEVIQYVPRQGGE